jgi:hypothetical protein
MEAQAKRRLAQELPQQAPNENLVGVCSIVQLVVIFSTVSIRIFISFPRGGGRRPIPQGDVLLVDHTLEY